MNISSQQPIRQVENNTPVAQEDSIPAKLAGAYADAVDFLVPDKLFGGAAIWTEIAVGTAAPAAAGFKLGVLLGSVGGPVAAGIVGGISATIGGVTGFLVQFAHSYQKAG